MCKTRDSVVGERKQKTFFVVLDVPKEHQLFSEGEMVLRASSISFLSLIQLASHRQKEEQELEQKVLDRM